MPKILELAKQKTIKGAISYRVLQSWRVPIFSKLSKMDNIELMVFYGADFRASKVRSHSGTLDFAACKLKTINVVFRSSNGKVELPIHLNLWSNLRGFDPDIIITEGASNAINNLQCFIYARFFKKKIVQWGLGAIQGRKESVSRKILNFLFFDWIERSSDSAIAYSSAGARYYIDQGFSPERVFIAVNTVDTGQRVHDLKMFAKQKKLSLPSPVPDIFNILYVGALSENKGIPLLLTVFKRLHAQHSNISLTIVGEGPLREMIERFVRDNGLADRVFLAGHVSEQIAKYFYYASVKVMPGLGGLAISDALAHGVPVICGIGDGSELDLIDGSNGQILDPLTESTLFFALKDLIFDKSRQGEWRRNCSKAITKYNTDNYVNEIVRCIKCLSEM